MAISPAKQDEGLRCVARSDTAVTLAVPERGGRLERWEEGGEGSSRS